MPSHEHVDLGRLSRTLAHVLRHDPDGWGVEMDEEGWVGIDDLVRALQRRPRWREVSATDVEAAVELPGKRRYEIGGGRIRARYGHSIPVRLDAETEVPPERLYHGTTPRAADRILRGGLRPMDRLYVHLSPDADTAVEVGRRRTAEPIVLVVRAREAHEGGVRFMRAGEEVWLADEVPSDFLERA